MKICATIGLSVIILLQGGCIKFVRRDFPIKVVPPLEKRTSTLNDFSGVYANKSLDYSNPFTSDIKSVPLIKVLISYPFVSVDNVDTVILRKIGDGQIEIKGMEGSREIVRSIVTVGASFRFVDSEIKERHYEFPASGLGFIGTERRRACFYLNEDMSLIRRWENHVYGLWIVVPCWTRTRSFYVWPRAHIKHFDQRRR